MQTNDEIQKIEKQALTTFTIGSAVVFAVALYYCYFTHRFMEMGIVSGAVIFLSLLVINTYKSFNKS